MITDKIIFPKHFKPDSADYYVQSEVAADGLTAEEVYPYLTNLADFTRSSDIFVSAVPLSPDINDPHLFAKEEFVLKTDRYIAHARVLEAIPPKGDRPGRITYRGEGTMNDSGKTFEFLHAFLLDVEKADRLNIISVLAVNGKVLDEKYFATLNNDFLQGLVKYVRGKETHTNHPSRPLTGAMVP